MGFLSNEGGRVNSQVMRYADSVNKPVKREKKIFC